MEPTVVLDINFAPARRWNLKNLLEFESSGIASYCEKMRADLTMDVDSRFCKSFYFTLFFGLQEFILLSDFIIEGS